MTTIPPLPQLEPDYPETIDELILRYEAARTNERWRPLDLELGRRRDRRDAVLDLQDELNDAGLVIVPEADWIEGQKAIKCIDGRFGPEIGDDT